MQLQLTLYEFWGILIGLITLVGTTVTMFWRRQLRIEQKMVTEEKLHQHIEEKAFPRERGVILETRLKDMSQKLDRLLTQQEVHLNKFSNFENEIIREISDLRVEIQQKRRRK